MRWGFFSSRTLVKRAALLALAFSCAASFGNARSPRGAQDGKGRDPIPKLDPYTKGAPKALEKAGYVSLAPVHYLGFQTPAQVREVLGGVPMLFVETKHFRLASSLDRYPLNGSDLDRTKLREALVLLKQRLPKVNTRTRVLDPWLRVHLYAALLEDTYAQFQSCFGLQEPSTKNAADSPKRNLGMPAKFTVLLTDKRSELERYTKAHCNVGTETLLFDYLPEQGTMFLGISFEGMEGVESNMRFAVAYGLARNMTGGFGGATYYGGLFWQTGLARWFAREGNEELIVFYDPPDAPVARRPKDTEWRRKVRARVAQDYFPSAKDLLKFRDETELRFSDQMMLWSRMDFLMSFGLKERRKMLDAMSQPLPWLADQGAYLKQFQQRFVESLKLAYNLDLEGFDRDWKAYVLKQYPRR